MLVLKKIKTIHPGMQMQLINIGLMLIKVKEKIGGSWVTFLKQHTMDLNRCGKVLQLFFKKI